MKILLVWPTPTPEVRVLLDTLRAEGHEVVYWVGEHPVAHLNPQGCVFHDHYDAWDGKPASEFAKESFVASADLIEKMYRTESLALTMMNKRYDKAPVDERKHVYYIMLAYWSAVLDRIRPEAVVFSSVPHSVYNYILYDLAKLRGLKTLCFEDTWVARRLLSYEDFWKGSSALQQAVREEFATESTSKLGEELGEYWKEHMTEGSRIAPPYMAFQRSTAAGLGLWKHRARIAFGALLSGNLPAIVLGYLWRFGTPNLRGEYGRLERKPDWNTPFVYFPLHLQPERTTSPQGGIYHDQRLVAETIAAALPEGWELYIKEHPSQWWVRGKERYSSARYRGYYEHFVGIPGTRLVPIATSTFELIERAKAVAVVTGTVGWEAILRGKLPIVFGFPWYRDYPGLSRVDSVESCRAALASGGYTTKEDVRRFLAALEKGSIRAYLENPLEEMPRYTPEENARMIADAIAKAL